MSTELIGVSSETAYILTGMFGAMIGSAIFTAAVLTERNRWRERRLEAELQSGPPRGLADTGEFQRLVDTRRAAVLALARIEASRSQKLMSMAVVYGTLLLTVGVALSVVVDEISLIALLIGMVLAGLVAEAAFSIGSRSPAPVGPTRLLNTVPSESLTGLHQRLESATVNSLVSQGWNVEPSQHFDLLAWRDDESLQVEIRAKGQLDRSDLRQMSDRISTAREHGDESKYVLVVPRTALERSDGFPWEEETDRLEVQTVDEDGRLVSAFDYHGSDSRG